MTIFGPTFSNRSPIWQSADSFIRGWYGFIQPQHLVDQTKKSIVDLANLYFVECITSNVTPEALTEIRQEFQELRFLVNSQTPDSYLNVSQFLNFG
jgi:hypothetical protein